MNKIFDINYKRAVLLLLPTFLRKEVLVAFLRAMTAPVVTQHNLFLTNRTNNLYRLRMNGQVCYLRKVLNDAFPEANGAIRIEDGAIAGKWQYAYNKSELKTLFIQNAGTLFYNSPTMLDGIHNFIVIIPQAIYNMNNVVKLRGFLNAYKLISKSYTII